MPNVFVLCTGRCGSLTFAKACSHITNFTVGHETRVGRLGEERFAYPERHIEVDNRLSWLLGRLEKAYGPRALYVHLRRDPQAVAESYARRYGAGIIHAYRTAIVATRPMQDDPVAVGLDYCATVNANIEVFLAGKPHKYEVRLEHAAADFVGFWHRIHAKGDRDAALREFGIAHNATDGPRFA